MDDEPFFKDRIQNQKQNLKKWLSVNFSIFVAVEFSCGISAILPLPTLTKFFKLILCY